MKYVSNNCICFQDLCYSLNCYESLLYVEAFQRNSIYSASKTQLTNPVFELYTPSISCYTKSLSWMSLIINNCTLCQA